MGTSSSTSEIYKDWFVTNKDIATNKIPKQFELSNNFLNEIKQYAKEKGANVVQIGMSLAGGLAEMNAAGRVGTASAFPTLHSIKTQWRRK